MNVLLTPDGMDMVVQLWRYAKMEDNGMSSNSCVNVPSTVDGMEHFVSR